MYRVFSKGVGVANCIESFLEGGGMVKGIAHILLIVYRDLYTGERKTSK